MIFNLNEFFSLQQSLNEREKHIAKLESELARMKEERDAWTRQLCQVNNLCDFQWIVGHGRSVA